MGKHYYWCPIVLALGIIAVSVFPGGKGQLSDTVLKQQNRDAASSELLWKTIVPFYLEKVILELNPVDGSADKLREEVFSGVSQSCKAHTSEWIFQIRNNSKDLLQAESWALHLTDAWAKAPEGFLSGHTNALGDYDECLRVRADNLKPSDWVPNPTDIPTSFRGKYCLSMIYPKEKLSGMEFIHNDGNKSPIIEEIIGFIAEDLNMPWLVPSFGSCFPATCSIQDAQIFVENLLIALKVKDKLDFYMFDCITDETLKFDTGDIVYSIVLGVVILICLLATLIDLCSKRQLNSEGKAKEAIMAFSLKRSLLACLTTKPDDESRAGLRCLSGLRFLTVAWIILAHTWEMPVLGYYPAWNKVDLNKLHKQWSTLLITNSNVAMDTFFTIAGLTVSYSLLKAISTYKNKILSAVIPLLSGLLRLTPMYALIIGFVATLWPFLGSGPYSGFITDSATSCQENWWTNLLYVNNFVNATFENMCLTDSWYFANEMQFLLLSPIIILSLWRWRSAGLIITILTITASVLTPAVLTQENEELPSSIVTRDFRRYFEDIYIKPWNRASPYICGILCGYLIFITEKSIKLSKLAILAGWLIATAAALAIILGIFPYYDPMEDIPKTEAALYAGFHRFGWGIIISWIIFACSKGYGWWINDLLAWRLFVPLGRLATATYIVSFPVQMILHLGFRQALTHDSYTMVNFFLSDLVLSLFVGFLFTLLIGMPCCQLDRILLKQKEEEEDEEEEMEMRPRKPRNGIFYDGEVSISMEPEKKSSRRRGGEHSSAEMQPRHERHGIFYNDGVSPSIDTKNKKGY